jgi:hypothetical protein
MIFQSASILLVLSLGTSAVKWVKKLNSDIFQLEFDEEREGKTIEEEEGCRPGFFCMIFEDDGFERIIKENENYEDEETVEVLEKVENYTRVKQNIVLFIFIFSNYKLGMIFN